MRILIVGAGIAGLTLTQLLRQRDIDVVTVEKEMKRGRHGYGIGLWPMGSRVLHGIKLYQRFTELSVPTYEYRVADRDGNTVRSYDFRKLFGKHDLMRMIMHGELIETLLDGIASAIRMNTTVERLQQQPDGVEVTFSDRTTDRFDLVVGCDGIHSTTRKQIFGEVPLRSTGWGGWAWWIDPEIAPQTAVTEYWVPDRFAGLYPAKSALFCFVGMPKKEIEGDPHHVPPDFVQRSFSGVRGDIPKILAELEKNTSLFFWDFSDLNLKRWHEGRVVLIGDAANAILPTAGVGASSAMESAAVLADELTRTDAGHIPLMLERYYKRHYSRAQSMQRNSRAMARLMFLESRALSRARNTMLKIVPRETEFGSFCQLLENPI